MTDRFVIEGNILHKFSNKVRTQMRVCYGQRDAPTSPGFRRSYAGQHDIWYVDIVEQLIRFSGLDTSNLAWFLREEFRSLGPSMDVAVEEGCDVFEERSDERISTTVREDKVLIGVELQRHILVVVIELDSVVEQVLREARNELPLFVAVVEVCQAIADLFISFTQSESKLLFLSIQRYPMAEGH
jgi:hypothetical protein